MVNVYKKKWNILLGMCIIMIKIENYKDWKHAEKFIVTWLSASASQ